MVIPATPRVARHPAGEDIPNASPHFHPRIQPPTAPTRPFRAGYRGSGPGFGYAEVSLQKKPPLQEGATLPLAAESQYRPIALHKPACIMQLRLVFFLLVLSKSQGHGLPYCTVSISLILVEPLIQQLPLSEGNSEEVWARIKGATRNPLFYSGEAGQAGKKPDLPSSFPGEDARKATE